MTPDRFRDCLTLLRWSQRGLAEALKCDDRLVRRWASGDADIPASVAAWLETLGKIHAELPPPMGWKRRATKLGMDMSDREIGRMTPAQIVLSKALLTLADAVDGASESLAHDIVPGPMPTEPDAAARQSEAKNVASEMKEVAGRPDVAHLARTRLDRWEGRLNQAGITAFDGMLVTYVREALDTVELEARRE